MEDSSAHCTAPQCELSVFSVSVLKQHMKRHYYSSVSIVKYHSVSYLLCTFSTPVQHQKQWYMS